MEKSILFANIVNYFTLCTIFPEFLYHFDKNPPIIIPNAQLLGHIQCHHIVNGFKNKMIS